MGGNYQHKRDVTKVVFFWSHLTTGNKDPFGTVLTCSWFGTVGLKHPVNLLCLWTMHSGNNLTEHDWYFVLCWPCISVQFLLITYLTHLFSVFIYFTSVHVSSNPVLIIRRINCFNTSSGIYHSVWVTGIGIPDSHPHRVINTRWCIDTIDTADDEHWVARNM